MTNQRVDEWGRVVLSESGLLELFYKGLDKPQEFLTESTSAFEDYNAWCKIFDSVDKQVDLVKPLDVSPEEFHSQRQKEWLITDEYKTLDIEAYLYAKCQEPYQHARVQEELALFSKHDMLDVLRLFVYITETLTSAGVWWGVGRGSSVASYCLFLIGVHKVDSIKYDLDIHEFIRER